MNLETLKQEYGHKKEQVGYRQKEIDSLEEEISIFEQAFNKNLLSYVGSKKEVLSFLLSQTSEFLEFKGVQSTYQLKQMLLTSEYKYSVTENCSNLHISFWWYVSDYEKDWLSGLFIPFTVLEETVEFLEIQVATFKNSLKEDRKSLILEQIADLNKQFNELV